MLKAMNDNTLRNGVSILFCDGRDIVQVTHRKREVICCCSRPDIACAKVADVWSIAFSRGGIPLKKAIRILKGE